MTLKRLIVALAVLVLVEGALFVSLNWDLVYLSQSRARLEADPVDRFRDGAERALARQRLSRRHLETIADVSAKRSESILNLRSLSRLAVEYPADAGVVERLADALRRAGRVDEAEAMYRRLLRASASTTGGLR
jgi:hypothetical protein